jgi:hypothetical protein
MADAGTYVPHWLRQATMPSLFYIVKVVRHVPPRPLLRLSLLQGVPARVLNLMNVPPPRLSYLRE